MLRLQARQIDPTSNRCRYQCMLLHITRPIRFGRGTLQITPPRQLVTPIAFVYDDEKVGLLQLPVRPDTKTILNNSPVS